MTAWCASSVPRPVGSLKVCTDDKKSSDCFKEEQCISYDASVFKKKERLKSESGLARVLRCIDACWMLACRLKPKTRVCLYNFDHTAKCTY